MYLSIIEKFFTKKPQHVIQYTPTISVGEDLKNIRLENINDLLDVFVDENKNIFIQFKGNVTLLSEKDISLVSGNDINIISGKVIGRKKGFINLNPIIKKFSDKFFKLSE